MVEVTAVEVHEKKEYMLRWLLGMPQDTSAEALEQVIRTRIHPELFKTVQYLNDTMKHGGPRFVRSVAEWLGYSELKEVYTIDAETQIITWYQAGIGDPKEMSAVFRELAVIGACVSTDLLQKLFTAVIAAKTSDTLFNRFRQRTQIESKIFWEEIAEMRRQADVDQVRGHQPQWVQDVQPMHVGVKELIHPRRPKKGQQIHYYRLPAQVRMFDPVTRVYDIQFHQPVQVERYDVQKELSIPWQHAMTGIQFEVALRDTRYGHHIPERYYLTAQQLEILRSRGTAVHTRIGRHEDIRFYPEYLQSLPGEECQVPDHPLVSLRVTQGAVDIQKLDPKLQLTVFV